MARTDRTAGDTTTALRCRGVRKHYHDGTTEHLVLDALDLEVRSGECVALLGRSGSGKSTLLNLLAGIDHPDAGRVEILGQDLVGLGEPGTTRLRRRRIGFVYQFFNLIPTLTAAENMRLPLELIGGELGGAGGAAAHQELVRAMLEHLGLSHRAHAFPDQLSGGEQQRVAIGRALIHSPAVVLADEPTGNLDAETGEQVLTLLTGLSRERNQTLVLVTHSLAVAHAADRMLTLDQGRLRHSIGESAW